MMDNEFRLELITHIAQDDIWEAIVLVGRQLLEHPALSSSPEGQRYAQALRDAISQVA